MLVSRFPRAVRMQLVLVVPGLLSHPADALAFSPPLARLASWSTVKRAADLDEALLAALALDAAAGPLAAVGAGVDVGRRWCARADPVTMSVGREDVRIERRVDDLDAAESEALARLLSCHFAEDGIAFVAARTDAWFVTSEHAFDIATTPVDASLDAPLRERMPSGRDAWPWHRWLTEAQMLLHEHALALRASHPVNAIWISHAGRLPARDAIPRIRVHATAERAALVARGIAAVLGDPVHDPDVKAALAAGGNALVVTGAIRREGDFDRAMREAVAPAVDALGGGRIDRLDLVADGPRIAAAWSAARPGWFARWRPRRGRFDVAAAVHA